MDTKLIGLTIVILIVLLFFVGAGSIIMSIIFDPDESNKSSHDSLQAINELNLVMDYNEPASIILESSMDFNIEELTES